MEKQKNKIYDTIIIGTGPAGFSAGIYAARRLMKTLIIGREFGGQVVWAADIENYPGFQSINNFELIEKLKDHAKAVGAEIINLEITKINKMENGTFSVSTHENEYLSKTIIIATGLSPKKLMISGEERLTGKGVSYCATCDSPLFKNKVVAVIGGGNSALDAAELLSNISEKVYLIYRGSKLKAFETLLNKVISKKNVEILLNHKTIEIFGEKKVEKIKVINKLNNEEKEILLQGIFIEVGRVASSDLAIGLVKLDSKNQIIVDEKGQTSQDGIFAAGDITNIPFKQIIIACGQGAIAALSAYEYLQLGE